MVITVIGLGFVGLTTALGLAEIGHRVYGIDKSAGRFKTIASGQLPFLEPGMEEVLKRHLKNQFIPTENLAAAVADSEVVFYCVGTPSGEEGHSDLEDLTAALEDTLDAIRDHHYRVLVIKSTIPPTTTRSRIIPLIEARGLRVGEDVGVAHNPEFLREGHAWEDFIHGDRIVLGVDEARSENLLRVLYGGLGIPVYTVTPGTGEFIKYLSNTLLATLISYANEMSLVADRLGDIDIPEAFRMLHRDHRWGGGSMKSYVYPGCGYGGYCLPKDTRALFALAKDAGFEAPILKQVMAINDRMPAYFSNKIIEAAGNGPETVIGILGLSFKPGSDDVRNSASGKIIRALNEGGYHEILAYDPVAAAEFQKHYALTYQLRESLEDILAEADLLVIATAWPIFKNLDELTQKPIIDCRYVL